MVILAYQIEADAKVTSPLLTMYTDVDFSGLNKISFYVFYKSSQPDQ